MASQGTGNRYDVFISYRRSSSEFAHLIATHLKAAGYRAFIDVEALRGGKFNEQLYDVIDNCKDFLVVLPENALDRCADPEDWVRKEVCRALEKGKNIVPVMLSGFKWPDPMPEGMESLKDYQALAATSNEYFDLSMVRLRKYLKSRSHARTRKTLLTLGIALGSLAILALIGIPLARKLSIPFYTKVADNLTMQTSIVALTVDSSDRLGKVWSDFQPAFAAAGPKERTYLLEDLEKDLVRIEKEADDLKVQVAPYQIARLSSMENLQLGLRGIDADDVLASYPLCLTFIDDLKQDVGSIREAVSDVDVYLEEDKTIREHPDVFRHSANIFYYGYLDIMAKMPEKALKNYNKLMPEWRSFPNGVGLGHTTEEYAQFIDKELKFLSDYGIDLSKRNLQQEQELLEMQKNLDDLIAEYDALYMERRTAAQVDTTKSLDENWGGIVLLSSFLVDALENEKDPDGVDHPVTTARIARDLGSVLKRFSEVYPAYEPASSGAAAYYRGVASGKYPYGGLVVTLSGTPEIAVGDIVTKINGKKTIPANYPSLSQVIQSNGIKSIEYLRLEGGTLRLGKADLTAEQNVLVFWPMGMGE